MSNPIKAAPTVYRILGSDKEVTATSASGDKYALDVNITGGSLTTTVKDKARYSHTVPVTTSAYTTLLASSAAAATEIEIFDSSGETLLLAIGAAASEVDKIYIFPGGNGRVPLTIPAGSRLSIKAVSANTASGECTVNLYGAA